MIVMKSVTLCDDIFSLVEEKLFRLELHCVQSMQYDLILLNGNTTHVVVDGFTLLQ